MSNQLQASQDLYSGSDVASPSGSQHAYTHAADLDNAHAEGQPPSSSKATDWGVGPFHGYFPAHDNRVRQCTAAYSAVTNDAEWAAAAAAEQHGDGFRTSTGNANSRPSASLVAEEEVPVQNCYVPPAQDNGEEDRDTFVDKGSAAAAEAPTYSSPGRGAGQPGTLPPAANTAATNTFGAASAVAKKTNSSRLRPAVTVHGPPSLMQLNAGPSPPPGAAGGNVSGRPSAGCNTSNAALPSGMAAAAWFGAGGAGGGGSTSAAGAFVPFSSAYAGAGGFAANTVGTVSPAVTGRGSANAASAVNAASAAAAANQQLRFSTSAVPGNSPSNRTTPERTTKGGASKGTVAGVPQYSRMNSSEAAPGIIYRATLPVRAMATDPEQPLLWVAVGDDPLATLRFDDGEFVHSKSVKDIEQVYCMAVVRIPEEHATTFKSASESPRTGLGTPKVRFGKLGKHGKKNARHGGANRKSGKVNASLNNLLLDKTYSGMSNADEADKANSSDDENNCDSSNGSLTGYNACDGGRDKSKFSNFLWCGLTRGHVAVVNTSTLEYQVIHNAHTQTVNKIWYWEARNKVWTAGREKGVHVWDPQRRVVLKKRNIAAILTDATYVDATDKVYAVAGDSCVRVFEPSGENVNVPKGQENRIKMKSDASVIQYHRSSGLVWVGLARGSVLMNPSTMDVERTLSYTFSAILFEGDKAIIAGQESSNGEARLMVLDLANPREPSVLAYSKFANPLPLGIHVLPHTRFAVAAQDDAKKGLVVAVFVYANAAALPHIMTTSASTSSGKYPEQRTEKVLRGPTTTTTTIGGIGQLPLVPAVTGTATAPPEAHSYAAATLTGSPPPPTACAAAETSGTNVNPSNNTSGVLDRVSWHRTAVVKVPPDPRADRKFNVEADHTNLVEAIGPEAQEIKSALKHLVKATDEVRQTIVQQRNGESTLADFSTLLRSRQQWLLEQGAITSLPVLPLAVTERLNRDYVTLEGKTIATAVEQLQHMYAKILTKYQGQQQAWERQREEDEQKAAQQQQQQQQQQQMQDASFGRLSATSPPIQSRPSSSQLQSQPHAFSSMTRDSTGYMCGAADSAHSHFRTEGESDVLFGPSAAAADAKDGTVPPLWASQFAASLQRERTLHEQQLRAVQLKTEKLAERNAALLSAFAQLQAHVVALGKQSLSGAERAEAAESNTLMGLDDTNAPGARIQEGLSPPRPSQQHMFPLPSSQQAAAAALFSRVSRGRFHRPKHVRQSTECLTAAIDELLRLSQLRRAARGSEWDPLGGTAVMQHSASALLPGGHAIHDDPGSSMDTRPTLPHLSRYQDPFSPSPSLPPANSSFKDEHDAAEGSTFAATTVIETGDVARAASKEHSASHTNCISEAEASSDESGALVDRPITSFRSLCAMMDAELADLRQLDGEVVSFWARLQNAPSAFTPPASHQGQPASQAAAVVATAKDESVETAVRSVEGGLLAALSPGDAAASSTLVHLMASRILQAMSWAECAQTVLRELTNVSGGVDNPFVTGSVHNALVPARATGVAGAAGAAGVGVAGLEAGWRQGPMEVLDYESVQERAEVLAKVSQLQATSRLELSNTTRIRGALLAGCRASKQCQGAHTEGEFFMHRLPGALCWSQTTLRLLCQFLEDAERTLTATVSGTGGTNAGENSGDKPAAVAASSQARDADEGRNIRTASAVGVAMTHWALFLLNLRAELLAVHHATHLYHTWWWKQPSHETGTNKTSASVTPAAAAKRAQAKAAAAPAAAATAAAANPTAAVAKSTRAPSLTDVSASLTSKGKLLLLYMQWCFPAFTNLTGARTGLPSASSLIAMPAFFTADAENDAMGTTASVQRSTTECATVLTNIVTHTEQLLRRVTLLLSYCHAIRGRAVAALQGSRDTALAQVVASLTPLGVLEADAQVPTEQEKAFLKSSGKLL